MGQTPSALGGTTSSHHKPNNKLPLFSWLFRKQDTTTTRTPNPEQPIKFQYKTRRKSSTTSQNNTRKCHKSSKIQTITNNLNKINRNEEIIKSSNLKNHVPIRTSSEPNLVPERSSRHRHRRKSSRLRNDWDHHQRSNNQQFGYEIQDVDAFLAKATIEKPANIPVVLAFPSVLYQTRVGGYQEEIQLPLGMVVNAVFKNKNWLYVQTPHAEEGYVNYAACLPLGIIPPMDEDASGPCWENSTDVFPKPSGNMTDTEKLSSKSECGGDSIGRCGRRSRNALSTCGERSVDKLYLRAAASSKRNNERVIHQTLLVITSDYEGKTEQGSLPVNKGEVVILLNAQVRGWFWVKNNKGMEGFIPAAIAGHGFL